MNRNVISAIQEHQMIRQGDTVYAAVSGGADSVALLHLLYRLQGAMGFSLRAMHLNHNLRDGESRRDQRFVQRLCRRLGIPLHTASAPVRRWARRDGQSVEEAARNARYAFFAQCAGEDGKIATAHTASDNVETVLLNLARGTGLRGLGGIPPVRGSVIRPLIRVSREQVEAYCDRHRLPYVTDSTNRSDDYTRNRIRHQVVPVLRGQNPRLEQAVGAMAASLRADEAYLESRARQALASISLSGGRYCRDRYLGLSPALRPRMLRLLLGAMGVPCSRRSIALMDRQIAAGRGSVQLSRNTALHSRKGGFYFGPPRAPAPAQPAHSLEIHLPQNPGEEASYLYKGKILCVTLVDYEYYKNNLKFLKKQFKNLLDCDRIEKILNLRGRGPGDSIRLAGRGCTKAVRRLLAEGGIPAHLRDSVLLLADSQGPLWVEGFGAAERAAPAEPFRQALLIRINEGKSLHA